MRILIYIILFLLGYRVLKRFFAPNFGEINHDQNTTDHYSSFPAEEGDKSNVIEDVDYEEVD